MDEIGVPHCITIDFQTLEDDTITVRNRDTTEQTRESIKNLSPEILI
jgi:glycyl-tRNA synthetase